MQFTKRFAKHIVSSALVLAVTVPSAFAALPEGVTSAITAAGTDGAIVGGAVLVVIIGIAAFKFIRRAL